MQKHTEEFAVDGTMTIAEAAELVGRCSRTIRAWCDGGKLRWGKDPDTGRVFICRRSVKKFLQSLERGVVTRSQS